MKNLKIASAILFLTALISCTDNSSEQESTKIPTESDDQSRQSGETIHSTHSAMIAVADAYLDLTTALTQDNSRKASEASADFISAMTDVDSATIELPQRKAFSEIHDRMIEDADHIRDNPDGIDHQRVHFKYLSKRMEVFVKMFRHEKPLFIHYCPMADNEKGATWISDKKEIENPYFGAKMLTCGELKEELN